MYIYIYTSKTFHVLLRIYIGSYMTNSLSHFIIHCFGLRLIAMSYSYIPMYVCTCVLYCELNFHFLDNVQANAWVTIVMECYFVAIIHSMSFTPAN